MKSMLKIQIIFLLFLTGCASPLDDMLNNKYITIEPTKQTENIGIWSGTMASYLVTMKIDGSGNGIWCYSHGSNIIQKIKVKDSWIYNQDGSRLEILKNNGNDIILKSPYIDKTKYQFIADPKLINASFYCANELKTS